MRLSAYLSERWSVERNLAIQVSYNIDDAVTYEREVGGLVKFLQCGSGCAQLIECNRLHKIT